MRVILLYALVSMGIAHALPALTGEQMQALIKARPELDEIRWKDAARGAPLKVRITNSNAQSVTVEKVLPTGPTVRTVPMSELAGIEFTLTPRELSMHQTPEPAAIPALRILWETRQATMRLPGSNVAETGIAFAKSLRLSGEVSALDEAGKILDLIRGQDTSDSRKDIARGEQSTIDFIRAIKSGKLVETDKLAWKITEEPGYPDAMLLATSFLADRHFKELKAIEEDNPRWMEDDEVRPVRDRLYQLSLDFALYPSLFIGSRQAEATVGLKKAVEVYQFTNQPALAKGTLEDIAALYPESEIAKETAPLLARLKQAEAAGDTAKISNEAKPEKSDEESKEEPAPATPPPPKRYNIFGD